jgi:hypothetical protein
VDRYLKGHTCLNHFISVALRDHICSVNHFLLLFILFLGILSFVHICYFLKFSSIFLCNGLCRLVNLKNLLMVATTLLCRSCANSVRHLLKNSIMLSIFVRSKKAQIILDKVQIGLALRQSPFSTGGNNSFFLTHNQSSFFFLILNLTPSIEFPHLELRI